jgi:hypothetical protein
LARFAWGLAGATGENDAVLDGLVAASGDADTLLDCCDYWFGYCGEDLFSVPLNMSINFHIANTRVSQQYIPPYAVRV